MTNFRCRQLSIPPSPSPVEAIASTPSQPIAICPEVTNWLFPGVVAAHQIRIAIASLDIMTEVERSLLVRATPKRRYEFAAGRACAAASLDALGLHGHRVAIGDRRMPLWPSGVVGSISHDASLACAVVGQSRTWIGLGIDVETPNRLVASSATIICRDDELDVLERYPVDIDRLGLVFSAKESVFKCYYPIERSFLDFQDVVLDWTMDATNRGQFVVRFMDPVRTWRYATPICGRWLFTSDRIYTSAFVLS